jgi:hypothetical protein
MPKAAMNENGEFPPDPSHVWFAWDILSVQTIARVAKLPNNTPNPQFGRGILTFDLSHRMAALRRG